MNIAKMEISNSTKTNLIHDLYRINPCEILLSNNISDASDFVNKLKQFSM